MKYREDSNMALVLNLVNDLGVGDSKEISLFEIKDRAGDLMTSAKFRMNLTKISQDTLKGFSTRFYRKLNALVITRVE